ncbi:Ger(x)C family spore germination C-terminal domain-containing protein [Paenibacillus solisilvae]|uniref:Ger(X)C family spore germination C-terminal domain-containing protein n=1 Tax=Paenibacillus solisilvae TaxID=2486751 RepID=A0ABW0W3Y5_9BACL
MIKNGKMTGTLTGGQAKDVLMLTNQFKSGVLQVPCEKVGNNKKHMIESIEVQTIKTKSKSILNSGKLKVKVDVKMSGNISELKCSKLETREDEVKFMRNVEQYMEKHLMKTIHLTQREKIDLLGIGNMLYRDHTKIWKKWKSDWDKRYSEADFEVRVSVKITNSLTTVEKPLYAK